MADLQSSILVGMQCWIHYVLHAFFIWILMLLGFLLFFVELLVVNLIPKGSVAPQCFLDVQFLTAPTCFYR